MTLQRHKPDSEYVWVVLGPIAGLPAWHQQAGTGRYPFPTVEAAELFASAHRLDGREAVVGAP